jgi:hypothetical protein
VRTVARFGIRNSIHIVGDNTTFIFGQPGAAVNSNGTVFVEPVILNPGITHTMLLYVYWPGLTTTAINGEVEVGWWER